MARVKGALHCYPEVRARQWALHELLNFLVTVTRYIVDYYVGLDEPPSNLTLAARGFGSGSVRMDLKFLLTRAL